MQERLTSFNFPEQIDGELLRKLTERAKKIGSLRTAVAHQIEEEGRVLENAVEIVLSQDKEGIAAAKGYTFVGTLILETESTAQLRDYQKRENLPLQVQLLRNDSSGFALVAWWEKQESEEELKPAALIGRQAGVRRFRQLYLALLDKKRRK